MADWLTHSTFTHRVRVRSRAIKKIFINNFLTLQKASQILTLACTFFLFGALFDEVGFLIKFG
jgi:hypothetical protein